LKFLVDENVSLAVAERLRQLGHEAEAVIESGFSSASDQKVFQLAIEKESILITRDHHFTNGMLFPPDKMKGIIYIRQGNLRSDEEVTLVEEAVRKFPLGTIEGKLLTIYKHFSSIR